MDSFGDYIYIIAIVVAGLSSFLKKKKVESTPKSKPVSTKRNWEDVLRDLIPIEEQEEKRVQVVPPVEQVVVKTQERKSSFNEGTSSLRGTKQVSQLKSQKKVELQDDNEIEFENTLLEYSFSNVEDVKRAFVLSEILNRKY